jgi:hypothetical protein
MSLKKIILISFIDVILQAILFCILHDAIVSFYSAHFNSTHDLFWGIGIELIFLKYTGLLIVQNFAAIVKQNMGIIISIIISLFYILILLPVYKYHPLKTLNLLLVGLFCIWLKLLFDRLLFILFKESKKTSN